METRFVGNGIMSVKEEGKVQPKSNLDFRLMSLTYKFRDLRLPRIDILKEVGIKAGFHVLDYGCGPGSYIVPLAELVGASGKIYALDVNTLAVRAVQKLASKKELTNVQTILSDCKTGLLPESLDVILLYDILHDLDKPGAVLAELHKVLRQKGILSVTDHHLKEDEIISRVTSRGLLKLSAKGKRTYSFSREE
jgi:ubiquinone/menaquinone biosynthesis C-methylase UbiE